MSVAVAVVGRGFGEAVHRRGWELAGARVIGVAGRSDWQHVVRGADVVSVATPPAAHAEVVLAALEQGARVLCEKPLATSVPEAEALARAAGGVDTAVNFAYRAVPGFIRLRELIDDGAELDVTWSTGSRRRATSPSWKDDPLQGGALSSYGVHALDYARWLLGDARVERATVAPNEDAFTAVLAHERGRANVSVSLVADATAHRVRAGDLVLENDDARNPVAFVLRRGSRPLPLPPPAIPAPAGADPRVSPFAAHARALVTDAERPTFTDGLHAQRLLEEVRRAAR